MLSDTSGALVATLVGPADRHGGQTALAWWASLRHYPLLGQVKWVVIGGGFGAGLWRKWRSWTRQKPTVPQEVVRQAGNFCVHATPWVIGRSISELTNNRGLARCYERKTGNEASFVLLSNIRRIVQRC